MFILTVLYPTGAPVDLDYYRDTHLPLVRRLLEPAGITELGYWQPMLDSHEAPYQLVAEIRFPDRGTGMAALAAHGTETQADMPNFTEATPLIMTGDLVLS